MINSVKIYFDNITKWKEEQETLRKIILSCDLKETLKWKQPCYTYHTKNIVIIGSFKEFCVLSFFKGVHLTDPEKLLVKQGENSRTIRILNFTSVDEIVKHNEAIKGLIFEAISIENSNKKQTIVKPEIPEYPTELTTIFETDIEFKTAFEKLTPGKQRGYIIHFTGAKQLSTRLKRIENYRSKVILGKGFHDCICGLSKNLPRCDGSHKNLKDFTIA